MLGSALFYDLCMYTCVNYISFIQGANYFKKQMEPFLWNTCVAVGTNRAVFIIFIHVELLVKKKWSLLWHLYSGKGEVINNK